MIGPRNNAFLGPAIMFSRAPLWLSMGLVQQYVTVPSRMSPFTKIDITFSRHSSVRVSMNEIESLNTMGATSELS